MANFTKISTQTVCEYCQRKSLLQQTLDRIASPRAKEFLDNGYQMSEEVLCIGSELHRYEIRDNAEELGIPIRCVFEPVPRNTAAAMAAIACI